MILRFRRACDDHRAALLDFVDRRAVEPRTARALAHLDHCRDCERELSQIALALVALRRLRLDIESAEPASDGWDRLRARIQRRAVDPWRWRASVGGLAVSSMLVAVLLAPMSIGRPSIAQMAPPAPGPAARAAARVEAAYLASIRAGTRAPETDESVDRSYPVNYPAEIREVRKEVDAASSSGRPPAAI
ncbi:MAG: hypothetical protein ACJ77B_01095 [Chloroflexota bacterium]